MASFIRLPVSILLFQNGVVERKNRHLLETAKSLLFQMQVPKYFWADAVSAAYFFINQMPSSILNWGTPCHTLFPNKPLFPIEPRVFGCTCFVRDVHPHTPKSTSKTLSHPGWKQAMAEEMNALYSNDTWKLVALPPGKSPIGCCWVYTVKVGPDGQIDRLKARLVAKGYTQQYDLNYYDTFSPVTKIASVRLLLSMAAMHSWPLFQLDIKNALLHGDLAKDVYTEQPLGFVAQGESGLICKLCCSLYGLK